MMRINDFKCKAILKAAAAMSALLLFAAVAAFGQQQINLTAAPTTTTLPDGTVLPMWGYFCGAAATGSTATCAALNPTSVGIPPAPSTWSPVVITVPTGTSAAPAGLTINLTNSLSFAPSGGSAANTIPTSIVIVGQVGGGLGSSRTTTASPNHSLAQGCPTWFIAAGNTPPGVPCTTNALPAAPAIPPAQGPRVQSMATEVAAGATTSLTWANLKPGTYLLESGTHPSIQVPMGLIGVLVVTTAPSGTAAGTAYPATANSLAVPYNAELPLEFSEIDPVQNKQVDQAVRTVGFSETAVWTRMNAFGPVTALSLTSGGSGYTATPTVQIGSPTGGSPAQATATATVGEIVTGVTFTGGSGCTAPTVAFTDTTGSGAAATATVSATGALTGVTVTSAGSLYTAPTATIGGCTTAPTAVTVQTAGSYGVIYALNLTNSGEGYTGAPSVTILPTTATTGTGAQASATVTLGGCGGGAHTCYPPAVNYTPFYYLINGVAFNKTAPGLSVFPATAGVSGTPPAAVTTGITGTVLARLVNAGLRLHVPSIVNSLTQGFNGAGVPATVGGFTLIAEDGNLLPNVAPIGATTIPAAPRVQTDVLMVPSKVYDVLVNVPTASACTPAPTCTGTGPTLALPIYDRELSLSGNSSVRDAGMLAYISVNNSTPSAALPVAAGSGVFAAAVARADSYPGLVAGKPFTVSDPSKGVIANDTNVYGVTLLTAPTLGGTITCGALAQSAPTPGMCANGTFTYTPSATNTTAATETFTYCANNGLNTATTPPSCSTTSATVTLSAATLGGPPVANNITYTSNMATFLKIASPGVLSVDSDPSNLPLTVVTSGTNAPSTTGLGTGGTLVMDPNGGFTASVTGAGTATCPTGTPTTSNCFTFTYKAQNSQGTASSAATVTLIFSAPSNLKVNVLDAQLYNNCNGDSACINALVPLTDYRWIIEEDKTFWVDPNCTTNSSISTPGCPSVVGPAGQSTIPTFGVNFHTSTMEFVAQGCTGLLSCEYGQTMICGVAGAPACPAGTAAGSHIPAVCDVGNGACRADTGNGTSSGGFAWVNPNQVHLDPAKRYYISVLPGDAANPFPPTATATGPYAGQPVCSSTGGNSTVGTCGHTMSGAPIPPACNILGGPNGCTSTSAFTQPVNVLVLPTPLPTGKLSVMVFEDDFPLNGEQDGGGGSGTVAPLEPGLGNFNIVLWDTFGGLGDATGQDTYDMFNMPLSNSLAGTIDPSSGLDACPVSLNPLNGPGGAGPAPASGMTGMIVTCPKYESDGQTLSPLAGQAVIANLMPEKFSVQAYPGADRIARGEEWVQTNTLDGQHPHDSFIRIGEPSYFQEYGPAGYHVAIGFANPAIINARWGDVCNGAGSPGAVGPCTNTIDGQVDVQRLSRTPDQRLYSSGTRDALAWTQCWVSLGDPDGEDFMFTKCDANGNFKFTNVPGGNWRLTIGDQWNDQIIDGLSTAANVGCVPAPPATTCTPTASTVTQLHLGNIGVQQWQANLYTRTYIDDNRNGIWDANEIGIPLLYNMIHYRDGHNANALVTDFNGVANFNETYPLFNWYVVDADDSATSTRYKTTGIHTVYDAGGPADGSTLCGPSNGARPCGTSGAYNNLANTYEAVPLPQDLSVPGAVYCAKADCTTEANASFVNGTAVPSTGAASTSSTGRIDPPWVWSEGWSGLTGQSNWIDFGKAPYASCPPACVQVPVSPAGVTGATTATTMQVGENGGIHGIVDYAATRPFDDASQMIQQPWEPYVPRVVINLYQEGFAADGVTPTLTMVDTTKTSSWDDWAQGFYPNSTAGSGSGAGQKPYMSCPGQGTAAAGSANQDLFYFTLFDQPNFLDYYNKLHSVPPGTTPPAPTALPYNSQYKCYDAMHIWNQLQPAPYDGKYSFPSSLGVDATSGQLLAVKGSTNGVASSMNGTNCTICVANPDSTDKFRFGTPMLPPGKYVVQVMMPPGFEVYKEEDKNLLIGDNFIAPVTQQFGGLGAYIFIIPDQASVASLYDPTASGYNPNNFQNQTTQLGLNEELSGVPGFPGFQDPLWPCVGEMRVVPDYLSLFPQAKEVAPFAGATRPLCDRKEITLPDQTSISVKFFIYTSTHIASKYTGVITDDYTSEFDPFAPQFGEKFAPPNMPVSTKDYLGNEISRVYSDHWGVYNGLTFSSWEVNPPNITGYSPTIMVQCMNDPGPIVDHRTGSATFGQTITDPLYNPAYSNFCYEEPYMPGLTNYTDTPVVPTQAFVGAAYNNVDCSYPDTTPAIAEVDTSDGIGPWVNAAGPGHTMTITALGTVQVSNSAYSGPSASVAPFNQKTVARHYGFGTQCTALSATCTAISAVTVGGKSALISSWSDTQIVATVPEGLADCPIQQQNQYGGSPAQCGQLVITAGNGRQSVDAVTITVGGSQPTHISATQSIQAAIDGAHPGDLLMIDPTCMTSGVGVTPASTACSVSALHPTTGTATQTASTAAHNEMLIMWKPVRLQGVGAASSIINANAQPAGKLLDPWRRHINCLFGLTMAGVPYTGNGPASPTNTQPYDPNYNGKAGSGYTCPDTDNGVAWAYFTAQPNSPQVDRLPLEATIGWDATLNGNLAEQLQEPSLMGAFEGAGITVLAKGLDFHGASPWTDGNEGGAFPTGTTLLTGVGPDPTNLNTGDNNSLCIDGDPVAFTNRFPSNFICNPSSIDGLSIINSSQGGGGIFAHGWAHYLQIANNRIYNNAGTLTGGISVGQGEFAGPYVQGGTTNAPPGSCSDGTGFVTNQHLPDCFQLEVNVHNNFITNNSSLGDELFSGTLSGGGGVTFCTGNDYYKFNYNWVCGNLSSGEGGGIVHLGEIQQGHIEHNAILLNQSDNPTIPTNGGGIQIMGTPDTDPTCQTSADADCPPGLSDGTGHGLLINANLIQGNMAESGSGGGIRLQQVNGSEVSTFPSDPGLWNDVTIQNNIIVNNVAGWDGAGISLQDTLTANIVNNTIAHNDSLASSGVLTQSVGTPDASAPAGSCLQAGLTTSCPQSSGVTSTLNSTLLTTTFTGLTITCPPGHYAGTTATNGTCIYMSYPALYNDLIYQNRSFYIGITTNANGTPSGTGTLNQQNLVSLFNAVSGTAAPTQNASGACTAANGVTPTYWDIGVRGDTGPNNHGSGFTITPHFTATTTTSGFGSATNVFMSVYCNGSRVPPECTTTDGCGGPNGYGVPPGIVDAQTPNPVFSLTPSATVDEGNNWINVSWGPLSLSNPSLTGGTTGNYGGGPALGNYAPAAGSPAIDAITGETLPTGIVVPPTDFFGNPRPNPDGDGRTDYGAVEVQQTAPFPSVASVSPTSGLRGTTPTVTISGNNLSGVTGVSISGGNINCTITGTPTTTQVQANCSIARGAALTSSPSTARDVTVTFPGNTATLARSFSVTGATLTISAPSPALTTTTANTTTKTGTVTVTNAAGASGSFTFSAAPAVNKVGTTGGTFSIVAPGSGTACTGTTVLAPGGSCTIGVQYAPGTSTATATGNVTVTGSGLSTATQTSPNFSAN